MQKVDIQNSELDLTVQLSIKMQRVYCCLTLIGSDLLAWR